MRMFLNSKPCDKCDPLSPTSKKWQDCMFQAQLSRQCRSLQLPRNSWSARMECPDISEAQGRFISGRGSCRAWWGLRCTMREPQLHCASFACCSARRTSSLAGSKISGVELPSAKHCVWMWSSNPFILSPTILEGIGNSRC